MTRSYTAARREHLDEPVTFDVSRHVSEPGEDGQPRERVVVETFACTGQVSTLLLSEFARQADLDTATPEGMALVAQFFRQAFGDEKEYGRFFRYATEHLDDEQMMAILAGLVEDFTGRPTKGRRPSPEQPSTTGPTSRDDSSLQVVAGEVVTPEYVAELRRKVQELTAGQEQPPADSST